MLFKKKERELSEQQSKWLDRIYVLKERVHQHESNIHYQALTEKMRIEEESQILQEVEKLEREILGFDDMMGHPMDMLEEIFPC